MNSERLLVAIDGPAGAGKSTIAAALARRLGVAHVDTGAYYRAATLMVLRAGTDPADPAACLAALAGHRLEDRDGHMTVDGDDVDDAIRSESVSAAVSAVAQHLPVRAALLPAQREGVGEWGAVVEGRDAGTVVVPDAGLKVWLTATTGERAARRAAQLGEHGHASVAVQEQALRQRDERDEAQMRRAAGVVDVDTTGRTVEDVVEELAAKARDAGGSTRSPGETGR